MIIHKISVTKNITIGGDKSKTYVRSDNGIIRILRRTLHRSSDVYQSYYGTIIKKTNNYYLTEEYFPIRLSTLLGALTDLQIIESIE